MNTYVVDGVVYAYEQGEWWVCGFQTDRDTIVLKSDVVIDGEKVNVKAIHFFQSVTSPKVLVISDGFESIYNLYLTRLETIYIPKTVTRIHEACVGLSASIRSDSLKTIVADKKSKYIKSVDGVLFTKSGKMLLLYPCRREGEEYFLPRRVKTICYGAFSGTPLKRLYLSKRKPIESYVKWQCWDASIDICLFGEDSKVQIIAK